MKKYTQLNTLTSEIKSRNKLVKSKKGWLKITASTMFASAALLAFNGGHMVVNADSTQPQTQIAQADHSKTHDESATKPTADKPADQLASATDTNSESTQAETATQTDANSKTTTAPSANQTSVDPAKTTDTNTNSNSEVTPTQPSTDTQTNTAQSNQAAPDLENAPKSDIDVIGKRQQAAEKAQAEQAKAAQTTQINQANQTINTDQTNVDQAAKQTQADQAKLTGTTTQRDQANADVNTLNQQIGQTQSQVDTTTNQINQQQTQVNADQSQVNQALTNVNQAKQGQDEVVAKQTLTLPADMNVQNIKNNPDFNGWSTWGKANNHYQYSDELTHIQVDPQNLTPEQKQALNDYATSLMNQIRNQTGASQLKTGGIGILGFTQDIIDRYNADNWNVIKNGGHDVAAIAQASRDWGISDQGQYYENLTSNAVRTKNPQTPYYSMNDLYRGIYDSFEVMLFEDAVEDWGHTISITGAGGINGTNDFAVGIDKLNQIHFIGVYDYLVKNDAKYQTSTSYTPSNTAGYAMHYVDQNAVTNAQAQVDSANQKLSNDQNQLNDLTNKLASLNQQLSEFKAQKAQKLDLIDDLNHQIDQLSLQVSIDQDHQIIATDQLQIDQNNRDLITETDSTKIMQLKAQNKTLSAEIQTKLQAINAKTKQQADLKQQAATEKAAKQAAAKSAKNNNQADSVAKSANQSAQTNPETHANSNSKAESDVKSDVKATQLANANTPAAKINAEQTSDPDDHLNHDSTTDANHDTIIESAPETNPDINSEVSDSSIATTSNANNATPESGTTDKTINEPASTDKPKADTLPQTGQSSTRTLTFSGIIAILSALFLSLISFFKKERNI